MLMPYLIVTLGGIALIALVVAAWLWRRHRVQEHEMMRREKEHRRRTYELALLKEVSDRVGHSLEVENVMEVITGSLHQLIDHSVAAYMLIDQDRRIFKAHLERSVSRSFVRDVRERMTKALSELTDRDPHTLKLEETVTGSVISLSRAEPVRSFFNVPLVIGDEVKGIFTVSDPRADLYEQEDIALLYKVVRQAAREMEKLSAVVAAEQEKITAMVESMTEGVIMTDRDMRVRVINPAARTALDLAEKGSVSIFDIMQRLEGVVDIRSKIEQSIHDDTLVPIEDVAYGGRFYHMLISPVKDSKGAVFGGVVILRDITHEEEVERMRQDFMQMMVHELRSPLDGIRKTTEFISGNEDILKDTEALDRYIGMIHESTTDMLGLVRDLLDIARIEAGKFTLEKSETPVREMIHEELKAFDSTAGDAKITLSAQIADDVPERIDVDRERITRVIAQFLSNAIAYTGEGGSVVVQALRHTSGASLHDEARDAGIEWFITDPLEGHPDAVVIAVTDSGEGLTQEEIDNLFDKFAQFESARKSEEKEETGLGLVIARGIVEAHGGSLLVGSEKGVGSTFLITLPLS